MPTHATQGSRKQVVLAGALAGLTSRFCISPLDVVKIRLQLQTHSLSDPLSHPPANLYGPVYKGTLSTLKTILREEGVTGLWKGNVPAEILYLTYGSLQFLTYRTTTQLLSTLPLADRLPNAGTSFIAGAVAGSVATSATYPLDLLRTRFAAQGHDKIYASLLSSVRDIYRFEGPTGFFRGLSAGIGQIVPYMGLFFSAYETLKSLFSTPTSPLYPILSPYGLNDAAAGVLASVSSKTAVFPLDTVRKRLQVQGPSRTRYIHRNIPLYERGVLATIAEVARTEGRRGLYRGLSVSLMKAAPASAVTMWTYERAMTVMRGWNGKEE
ncbi:mitochondrial thiamine pyrophosphate transporter [Elasticomyces elasticus]|nr:mitochondrial thiamine pyrophosphate transporter [Elasticomyces elasticus]